MFKLKAFKCFFVLFLHGLSEAVDSLDLLQQAAQRTIQLKSMSEVNPDFQDDWELQKLAYDRLLKQSVESWSNRPDELSERYSALEPSQRVGFKNLIKSIIPHLQTQNGPQYDSSKLDSMFPEWNKEAPIVQLVRDNERLTSSISILNACYMEGSDYFPGWGYKRVGYSYYCGKEVNREFINSYWMTEKKKVTVSSTSELLMKLSAAEELSKLVPDVHLGPKLVTDIDGEAVVTVKVRFKRKMTIRTTTKHKYGTERVWAELFEGKDRSWPWEDIKYNFVGNTYAEVHGPTGSKVVSQAVPVESDDDNDENDDLEYGPIIGGERQIIDGVTYQIGYQLRYWETEVLGTSVGVINQDYLPCQYHKVDVMKAKLADFASKIPELRMESGDLHHDYNGKNILYRRVGFKVNTKLRIKRRWYNQRLREYFNIYRRKVDGWFSNWERIPGKRQTEREWNMNTLAFDLNVLNQTVCQGRID